MKKETKEAIKDTSIVGCLFAGFVVALVILSNVGNVIYEEPTVVEYRKWVPIIMQPLGDNNPGEYGWLNFSAVDYNDFTYTTNLTHNSSVYASGDTNNSITFLGVPHSTPMDLTLKLLLNVTWEDSDGTFQKDYIRCWVNSSEYTPAISTQLATIYNITGTADPNHYWVYAVVDNSGSGYTITDGQYIPTIEWRFEGFFVAGTL